MVFVKFGHFTKTLIITFFLLSDQSFAEVFSVNESITQTTGLSPDVLFDAVIEKKPEAIARLMGFGHDSTKFLIKTIDEDIRKNEKICEKSLRSENDCLSMNKYLRKNLEELNRLNAIKSGEMRIRARTYMAALYYFDLVSKTFYRPELEKLTIQCKNLNDDRCRARFQDITGIMFALEKLCEESAPQKPAKDQIPSIRAYFSKILPTRQ